MTNSSDIIERIIIKKLFKRFDYEIKFNENVSILIAPNGCGKTTIFKFIDFITHPEPRKLSKIIEIPFELFELYYSSGKRITISKKDLSKNDRQNIYQNIDVEFRNLSKVLDFYLFLSELSAFSVAIYGKSDQPIMFNFADKIADVAKEIRLPDIIEDNDGSTLRRSPETLKNNIINRSTKKLCDDLLNLLSDNEFLTNTLFVSANRIKDEDLISSIRRVYHARSIREEIDKTLPLNYANNDTCVKIKRAKDQYNNNLAKAKSNLNSEFLIHHDSDCSDESFIEFSSRWHKYQDELKKYYDIGFISTIENVIEDIELKKSYEEKKLYLQTYLKVFEPVTEPFQEIYDRYKLLADILNKRNEITGKIIKFSENGILINCGDDIINLDCLSSGEKNDLVMFYYLIFDTLKNEIVLIDEPEISLHIEWQEEFIDHLIKICKLNNFQAIVATHSPNIINNHFDLLAEREMENHGC